VTQSICFVFFYDSFSVKFFGAFIALAICALCGLTQADISLKLRQQQQQQQLQQQQQQPLITKEQYYKTGGGFQESNYGNSGYQIFEVHNHFAAKGPAYLPPQGQGASGHANDESLDLSFLNFPDAPATAQVATPAAAAPAAAPASIPVPFPSNYQHDFQRKAPATSSLGYSGTAQLSENVAQHPMVTSPKLMKGPPLSTDHWAAWSLELGSLGSTNRGGPNDAEMER